MSKIEEIERAVEQLSPSDFIRLAAWVDRRRRQLAIAPLPGKRDQAAVRERSAFLRSYAPQDDGLYEDAAAS